MPAAGGCSEASYLRNFPGDFQCTHVDPFNVTLRLILHLLTQTDGLRAPTRSETQTDALLTRIQYALKSGLMRTGRAGAGRNIKSPGAILASMLSAALDLLLDELPAALPELSRRRGRASKKGQTQAAGSPAFAAANSNEAGCQSGSIVGPAVLLCGCTGPAHKDQHETSLYT